MLTTDYVDATDSSDTSADQALVDPFGFAFDSASGAPIDGAQITLIDADTGAPATVFGDDGTSAFPVDVTTGGSATDSGRHALRVSARRLPLPGRPERQLPLRDRAAADPLGAVDRPGERARERAQSERRPVRRRRGLVRGRVRRDAGPHAAHRRAARSARRRRAHAREAGLARGGLGGRLRAVPAAPAQRERGRGHRRSAHRRPAVRLPLPRRLAAPRRPARRRSRRSRATGARSRSRADPTSRPVRRCSSPTWSRSPRARRPAMRSTARSAAPTAASARTARPRPCA